MAENQRTTHRKFPQVVNPNSKLLDGWTAKQTECIKFLGDKTCIVVGQRCIQSLFKGGARKSLRDTNFIIWTFILNAINLEVCPSSECFVQSVVLTLSFVWKMNSLSACKTALNLILTCKTVLTNLVQSLQEIYTSHS